MRQDIGGASCFIAISSSLLCLCSPSRMLLISLFLFLFWLYPSLLFLLHVIQQTAEGLFLSLSSTLDKALHVRLASCYVLHLPSRNSPLYFNEAELVCFDVLCSCTTASHRKNTLSRVLCLSLYLSYF